MWTVQNFFLVGSVLMHIDVHAGVSAAPLAARQRSRRRQRQQQLEFTPIFAFDFIYFFEDM